MIQRLQRWFKGLVSKEDSAVQIGIALQKFSLCVVTGSGIADTKSVQVDVEADDYSSALTKAFDLLNIKSGQCQIVLSPDQYQVVQVERPSVPNEELVQALPWAVKDFVSYQIDDLIVDYLDVPGPPMQANQKLNVVCCSKALLVSLVQVLDKHRVTVKGITTEEVASVNLLPESEDAAILITQQTEQEVCIQIVKSGTAYFSRRLRGYVQLPQQTAEQLQNGLIDNLLLELQRSSDYFESQLRQMPIRKVVLSLPTPHMAAIQQSISQALGFSVELVEHSAEADEHHKNASFNIALGGLQMLRGLSA